MQSFTDTQGRDWIVNVHTLAIDRVKAALGVDLREAYKGELLRSIMTDPAMAAAIVIRLCEPQANERNVSIESLSSELTGDCLDKAREALLESIMDFIPGPQRAMFRKAIAITEAQLDQASEAISGALDEGALQKEFQKNLAEMLSAISATDSPGSSESTQGT